MEATFCFVDLAGFSALTEAHGDQAAADLVLRFTTLVETAVETRGRLVKTIGDVVLIALPSPSSGIDFIAHLCRPVARERDFPIIRAGLHPWRGGRAWSRCLRSGGELGCPGRRPGSWRSGACDGARDAARAAGLLVEPLGPVRLHNVRDSVELFSVDITGAVADVIDPVCRMRVVPEQAVGCLRVGGIPYWFCSLQCAGLFAASPDAYATHALRRGSGRTAWPVGHYRRVRAPCGAAIERVRRGAIDHGPKDGQRIGPRASRRRPARRRRVRAHRRSGALGVVG